MKKLLIDIVILMALCAGVAQAAASDQNGARSMIEKLDTQLLDTMKQADTLGFAGRYKKLAPVIDRSFDLDRIARLALGDQWERLNSTQQKAYKASFRKDTIATYAQRFDTFDGERFDITGASDAPGGRTQVKTVIIDSDGKKTPINYVLENDDGDWRIVNVVARGVSDLALKRGQYTGVIRKKGPAAFVKQFDKEVDKYPALQDS